jgi:hypothetical protein
MANFYEYLAKSKKEYAYRIKSVVAMDDRFISILKKTVAKYGIIKIDPPKKTIAQSNPLDFPNIPFAEVWITNITTHIPVSTGILLPEIRGALNIPEKFLVVRTLNDPMEIETQRLDSESEAAKSEKTKDALLSNDPKYAEWNYDADKESSYGDAYNKKFLGYLAQVAADREFIEASVNPENEPKKLNIFSWLKEKPQAEDFNKEFDTVKPVSQLSKKPGGKTDVPANVAIPGNFDSHHRNNTLKINTKKGK